MSTNATEEILPRQLAPSQLAVAGVAIAVISMILEFIALSGFAPSVSTYLLYFFRAAVTSFKTIFLAYFLRRVFWSLDN